jgi:hypothetical protein
MTIHKGLMMILDNGGDDDDDVKICSTRDMGANTSQFTFNPNTPTANILWNIEPLSRGDYKHQPLLGFARTQQWRTCHDS